MKAIHVEFDRYLRHYQQSPSHQAIVTSNNVSNSTRSSYAAALLKIFIKFHKSFTTHSFPSCFITAHVTPDPTFLCLTPVSRPLSQHRPP